MFLEEGATIGVGCVASATALFDALAVPWPRLSSSSSISKNVTDGKQDKVDQWILIWGASCVTGMMATQLARLAGLRVFAVAGLHNAPELRELGAERVVDRHRPEDAIAEAKNLGIALAIDCVGEKTATYAVRALQSGGRMVYLVKRPTQELLDAHEVLAMEVLIKKFHEDIIFGKRLVDLVSDALYQRRIRPVRHEGINGGLAGIERGLKMLMEQKVSGRKLVVRVE